MSENKEIDKDQEHFKKVQILLNHINKLSAVIDICENAKNEPMFQLNLDVNMNKMFTGGALPLNLTELNLHNDIIKLIKQKLIDTKTEYFNLIESYVNSDEDE